MTENEIIEMCYDNNLSSTYVLDTLFDEFDNHLYMGHDKQSWLWVEEVLEKIDVTKIKNDSVCLVILIATLPVKNILKGRDIFVNKCKDNFLSKFTETKTDRLLQGLE